MKVIKTGKPSIFRGGGGKYLQKLVIFSSKFQQFFRPLFSVVLVLFLFVSTLIFLKIPLPANTYAEGVSVGTAQELSDALLTYDNAVINLTNDIDLLDTLEFRNKNDLTIDGGPNKHTIFYQGDSRALYIMDCDNIILKRLVFDSVSDSVGGGLLLETLSNPQNIVLNDVTIQNGKNKFGGAILAYANNNIHLVGSSKIESNIANYGGAVVLLDESVLTMADEASINDNSVTNEFIVEGEMDGSGCGGAVYLSGKNSKIYMRDNSQIAHNSATENGGGLHMGALLEYGENDKQPILDIRGNASIVNNSARFDGGGIYFGYTFQPGQQQSLPIQASSKRSDNSFSLADIAEVSTITGNARVANNTATNGGGLYLTSPLTFAQNAHISSNTATKNGGGIYLEDVVYDVELNDNATINNNTANWHGGGIFSEFVANIFLNDYASLANNNAGIHGGGIYLEVSGNISINDYASLTSNSALVNGGGLYAYSDAWLNLEVRGNGNVDKNYAGQDGGGIYLYDDKGRSQKHITLIDNAHITNNYAKGNGGGLFLNYDYIEPEEEEEEGVVQESLPLPRSLNLLGLHPLNSDNLGNDNTVIANNTAELNGGGIWLGGDTADTTTHASFTFAGNMRIENNTAFINGGGVYTEYYENLIYEDLPENKINFSGNKASKLYLLKQMPTGTTSFLGQPNRITPNFLNTSTSKRVLVFNNYDISSTPQRLDSELHQIAHTVTFDAKEHGYISGNVLETLHSRLSPLGLTYPSISYSLAKDSDMPPRPDITAKSTHRHTGWHDGITSEIAKIVTKDVVYEAQYVALAVPKLNKVHLPEYSENNRPASPTNTSDRGGMPLVLVLVGLLLLLTLVVYRRKNALIRMKKPSQTGGFFIGVMSYK